MHRIDARRFAVPLLALFAALTAVPVRSGDHPAANKINEKIADFSLQTADGKPAALHDFKDKKAVVVVFLSFDCPVSTSYAPDLAEMAKTYAGKGVAFLGVDGSDEGDAAAVAKRAAEFKLPFPVLKDERRAAADALHAEVTPEAFVLDGGLVLRYRGRIDDGYSARLKRNREVTHHDLRDALDEVLAGKDVTTPVTKADRLPHRRARTRPTATGAGHVPPRRGADPARELPAVPSAQRDRPVRAHDLPAGRQLGGGHQRLHAEPKDAALEAGRGRAVPQRTQAVRQGPCHPGGLGGRRHAGGRSEGRPAAAAVRRGLAARRAGPGADRARGDDRSAPAGRDLFRCFVLPTEPGRGQVRHGHRGQAGQQPRAAPHAQFRRSERQGPQARTGGARPHEGGRRAGPRPRLHGAAWASASTRRACWAAGRRASSPTSCPTATAGGCPRGPTW